VDNRLIVQSELELGDLAAEKIMSLGTNMSILDVGGGYGRHSLIFARYGHKVTFNDISKPDLKHPNIDFIIGDFTKMEFKKHDVVFVSHVLEHQLNVNNFLKKVSDCTKDNGIITITVPPPKGQIVSGHFTIWNIGLVLYNLVMVGLDCSNASAIADGYNMSIFTRKKAIKLPKDLKYDFGDLTTLKKYFPPSLDWGRDSFNGDIGELNYGG
jgi:SAM-dependent methyltransferase